MVVLVAVAGAPWAAALLVEERRSRAVFSGALFGMVFWCASVPWVAHVVTVYGGQSRAMGVVCVLLLALILSEWPALVGWAAVSAFPAGSAGRLVVFPILWMASEHARSVVYKGFPWNLTGNALYRNPQWIQSASIWGVFGLGALVAGLWALLAWALAGRGRRSRLGALMSAAALVAAAGWAGSASLARAGRGGPTVSVSLIQPNIAQSGRTDPEGVAAEYESVIGMAMRAARKRPDLIVIPESALPLTWQRSDRLRADLLSVAAVGGSDILFNDIEDEADGRYYNVARLLTPSGLVPRAYRKVHLVPFGEYVPLPRVFFFMQAVTREVGSFSAARRPILLVDRRLRLGPAVCYEMTYPSLPRQETHEGANLLVTISNDAWYGRAGAQAQHFAAMPLRAVENGRAFARAAITGISGFVDDRGRILGTVPEDRAGILDARLRLRTKETVWTRGGRTITTAVDAIGLAVLLLGVARSMRRR